MKIVLQFLSSILLFAYSLSADDKPNIVLIMADDIGYECFSSYGSKDYNTVNLDQLAANGMRFKHCNSQPLCTPSRVQILTGRYNNRNYRGFGWLDPKEITFANVLKDAGYETCIAGKWQLGGNAETIKKFGFDSFCLWNMHKYTKQDEDGMKDTSGWLQRFDNPTLFKDGEWYKPGKKAYGPQECTDFICDFIGKNKAKPFLVYYPMILTHDPFVPTPDSASRKQSKKQNFVDMTHYMDKLIGQIVKKLEQEGLREKTIILFTGDNGTHSLIESETKQGKIRGGKSKMTDAGTRVPLIINWPGTIQNKVSDELIDFSDVLPTLAEIAGAKTPKDRKIDGFSFLPVLKGQVSSRRDSIFCYYWGRGRDAKKTSSFVRNQNYKLYNDGRFYKIDSDVLEESPLQDLNKEELSIKEKLEKALANYLKAE